MWKYVAIAVVSLTIGLVASPVILRQLASKHVNDVRTEALKAWSSHQKDWPQFSRFIEVGGRAYWKSNEVYNGLVKGMNEEDIRRDIGPPDAVLIGRAEISKSFKLGVQSVSASQRPRRPMDYVPYLHDDTVGLYVYKMGRIAHDVSRIELQVMCLEFSALGSLMEAHIIPVSPSNPIGNFAIDTRTNQRVRTPM